MLSGSGAEGFHGRRARNSQRKREPSGDRQRAARRTTEAGRTAAAPRVSTTATERRYERGSVATRRYASAASEPELGSIVAAKPAAAASAGAPESFVRFHRTIEHSAPAAAEYATRDAERGTRSAEYGAGLPERASDATRQPDGAFAWSDARLGAALGCAANSGAAG